MALLKCSYFVGFYLLFGVYLVLISPYYQISKWFKLLNMLKSIKNGVELEIYVREDAHESINEIEQQGYIPTLIPHLHTKLYFNENKAIVSSMNLHHSSDTNSLDIGLITENAKEYDQLLNYYKRYIQSHGIGKNIKVDNNGSFSNENQRHDKGAGFGRYYNWRQDLESKLSNLIGREVFIQENYRELKIQAGNNYTVSIENGYCNSLSAVGILSGKEFEYATNNFNIFKSGMMKLDLLEGKNRSYDTICGTISNIKSKSISNLVSEEQPMIVDSIVQFIAGVNQLKQIVRGHKYSN
jgi:hypothetical protein